MVVVPIEEEEEEEEVTSLGFFIAKDVGRFAGTLHPD
jgi:hypothetical protein